MWGALQRPYRLRALFNSIQLITGDVVVLYTYSMVFMQEMGRRLGYTFLKIVRPQEFEFEGRRPYAELDPHFVNELVYMRL